MSTREAIESALVEAPDDLASHAAYADLLHEQGDPRGDLIQVQLALEDAALKPAERKRLQARERELLKKHQREWLGPLAPYLLDNEDHTGATFRFDRGWVTSLVVPYLSGHFATAIAKADLTLLTELSVETSNLDHPLRALGKSKRLNALRVLKLGKDAEEGSDEMMFPCDGQFPAADLSDFLKKLPHVEQLYLWVRECHMASVFAQPMPHLRYLKLYHLDEEHPLKVLAENPSLGLLEHLLFQPTHLSSFDEDGNPFTPEGIDALGRSPHLTALTHLQIRMSRAGDDGVRALLDSGLLSRLELLDLRFGTVTDVGAGLIANAGPLPRLERLDLTNNRLTHNGQAVLRANPRILTAGQYEGDDAYFEVHFE